MLNFSYANPTRLVFGRSAEHEVGRVMTSILGRPGKVLVLFGGGSAHRTGILEAVEDSLQESGFAVIEMGGVQPNPRMGFVRDTIDWVRDQGIRAVVAVGGGSVIDTAKAVAAGLEYEGDAWDFFAGRAQVEWALPVFAVLTIPAAGSEQSIRAVITHHGTKTGIGSEHIRPKAAFINPERFLTLPAIHISAGVCDMLSHICERYFSNTAATDFVDGQAEAALRTIIKFGPKVLADPSNYDAWCQIGLAGSFAHNGIFGLGREVMGVGQDADDAAAAALGIEAFKAWLKTMKLPLTLQELGAVDCPIEALARHCCRKGAVGHFKPLEKADVEALLRAAQ